MQQSIGNICLRKSWSVTYFLQTSISTPEPEPYGIVQFRMTYDLFSFAEFKRHKDASLSDRSD